MNQPASIEAESALIARLLVDQSALPTLTSTLSPEAFYDPDMAAMYAAMVKLSDEGKPIDVVTLRDEIGHKVSPPVLSLTPGHHAPLEAYVESIKKEAFRRQYLDRLASLASLAQRESDPARLLSSLQDGAARLALGIEVKESLGRINLEEHRQPPEPPWGGVVSPSGTTVVYGDGGDGKGWVVARLISLLQKKVAILDFEMQPQEWGYRLDKFGINLRDVPYFSPATTFDKWATESAAKSLREAGVEYLVVDSAMYASNVDDPYSPNGALAYGRARRRLDNLPALLLAHTTGNVDKIFGSVYWKNECRIAWRLNKDFVSRQRNMECRKANGYSWLEGKRFEIEFNEDRGILNLHEHGKPWHPQPVAEDEI